MDGPLTDYTSFVVARVSALAEDARPQLLARRVQVCVLVWVCMCVYMHALRPWSSLSRFEGRAPRTDPSPHNPQRVKALYRARRTLLRLFEAAVASTQEILQGIEADREAQADGALGLRVDGFVRGGGGPRSRFVHHPKHQLIRNEHQPNIKQTKQSWPS